MRIVEERIRRAMEEGKFDNLAGKGKPLRLEDEAQDDEWRVAYHILKNGGYTLPWIETAREIDASVQSARQQLSRTWAWRQAALQSGWKPSQISAEWSRALRRFSEQITAINKRIFTYNLEVPSSQFQRRLLNLQAELARLTETKADSEIG